MRLNHESLRSRLWTIAAGGVLGGLACGSSPTPGAAASATPAGASPAGPSAPAGRADGGQAPSPTASGSPLCGPGVSCVPGSLCSFLDGRPSPMGPSTTFCRCDQAGRMVCPAQRADRAATVCIPRTGPACLPFESAEVRERVRERMPGCPGLVEASGPSERGGGGQVSCCYEGMLSLCQGRPLRVGGRAVVAGRRRGGDWG